MTRHLVTLILASLGLFACIATGRAACGPGSPITSPCPVIVFDGDSISAGAGARETRPETLLRDALGIDATTANVAAGGRPVRDCLALYDRTIAPRRTDAPRLIVFHAGDNDIAQGRDAVTAYADFTAYVARAHADGWRVLVSTELPRPNWTGEAQGRQLDAYNRMLLENRAGADAVVDLAADPALFAPAGRLATGLYTPDAVHPNDAGYRRLNALLAPAAGLLLQGR